MRKESIVELFVMAGTDVNLFEAIRLTNRKVNVALDRLFRAGYIFDKTNNIVRDGKLSSNDIEKLDAAVRGILFLHSANSIWNGRRSLKSVNDKVRMIAEFNIALNEAVVIATEKAN